MDNSASTNPRNYQFEDTGLDSMNNLDNIANVDEPVDDQFIKRKQDRSRAVNTNVYDNNAVVNQSMDPLMQLENSLNEDLNDSKIEGFENQSPRSKHS